MALSVNLRSLAVVLIVQAAVGACTRTHSEACSLVDPAAVSGALGLQVRAEPSIIEGAIDICHFYRDPGPSEHSVASLHLQRQDAQEDFESLRDLARTAGFAGFRDEDLAAPAYSTLTVTEAMVAALVPDRYLEVHINLDHYGQPPDQARLAALRLMRQAIAAATD